MSEDPIGFANNNINFYRYAINDPIIVIDKMGLDDHSDFKAIFNQMIDSHKNYRYYEPFGLKTFLSVKLLNLFDNAKLKIKLKNDLPEVNSAQYRPYHNTLEFRSNATSSVATHELVHAYNDLVLGFWSEASDEAMAYTVEGLLGSFPQLQNFEGKVFNGECPYSSRTSQSIFSSWNNLWGTKDATIPVASIPQILLQVRIKPNARWETTRNATENDYKSLNKYYGIKISCGLVKDYIKNRLSECKYCDNRLSVLKVLVISNSLYVSLV
jgi:hypothetical protein